MMNDKRILMCTDAEAKAFKRDDGGLYFSGTATSQAVDRHGEVVVTEGLRNLEDYMSNPVLRWQHSEPIGHMVDVKQYQRPSKITFTAKLAPTQLVATTVWPLLENGSVKTASIGFSGHEREMRNVKGADVLHWTDWSWYETSLVDVPANPDAMGEVLKAKGYTWEPLMDVEKGFAAVSHPRAEDMQMRWDSGAAEKRMRAWAGAMNAPNEKYASGFLWHDTTAKAEDSFADYKLPVCDVVDGEPQILWKAVVAVRGVLAGARGGVDMPEGDQAKCFAWVAKQYKAFGEEEPEKTVEAADWKDVLTETEKQVVEAVDFADRLRRLYGNAQGVHDLLAHWRELGLSGLFGEDDIPALKTAQERIADLLATASSELAPPPVVSETAVRVALGPVERALAALAL